MQNTTLDIGMTGSRHRHNRLLAALPSEILALLEPSLKEVSFEQGVVFLESGEVIEQVYFPQSGMISLLIATTDGDMIETTTVGREGAVGLHRAFGQRRAFTRAVVQIAGRFSVIPANAFHELALDNKPLQRLVTGYTELLWAEAQQVAACNAVHDASSRLCRWLLQSADRVGSGELSLTQEFLAQMLGVRRTTVTLLAQELQKRGAIRYSRGRLNILNRSALEDCACECYGIMRHDNLSRAIGLVF